LSDVKFEFSRYMYIQNSLILNFMKMSQVVAEFHADRWTDGHDEANSRVLQFCECT